MGITKNYLTKMFDELTYKRRNHEKITLKSAFKKTIKYNNKQNKILKKICRNDIENCYMDDIGDVYYHNSIVAQFYIPMIGIKEDLTSSEQNRYDKFISTFNTINLWNKPILGGYRYQNNKLINGKIIEKKMTSNFHEYKLLKFMEEQKVDFLPRYLGTTNDKDQFTYFKGHTMYSLPKHGMNLKAIENMMKLLKTYHQLCRELTNSSQVYVHGDLSNINVVFDLNNKNQIIGIIDWDETYIGDAHIDLIYILWTWINIGYIKRNDKKILKKVIFAVNVYDPPTDIKNNFSIKMLDTMNLWLTKVNVSDPHYERIVSWVEWSKLWVIKYKKEIEKLIG